MIIWGHKLAERTDIPYTFFEVYDDKNLILFASISYFLNFKKKIAFLPFIYKSYKVRIAGELIEE